MTTTTTTTPTTPPSTQAEQDEPTTGTDGQQQPATSPQDAPQNEQQAQDAQDAQDAAEDAQDDAQRESGPGAEAARYRRQLRAAEVERDALRGQLEQAQRREVERAVGDALAVPGDLLEFGGHELGEFVRDDGSIDDEMVRGAAAVLVGTRPGLARVARPTLPPSHGAGYRGPSTVGPAGWAGVLRPS